MLVGLFSRADKTLKVATNLRFVFCLLIIFCSSEESPATNAWVQFIVITPDKLLHYKGFYNANVPEGTQKLALRFFFAFFGKTHHRKKISINLLLTILNEIIKLQKIYCYSLNKLRLIRLTRTNQQLLTDIEAL